mmetsp:Transcript_54951/g.126238  ORF Transcript_54951/g.126238 Transcript_54951/m.126238 type:complete len:456 (+) Transcript_54951:36-1403(+)|eukprot:CAMPEP_0204347660 /NCGR_PEP_ID=MMETSP0469-20131031/28125_1 /ASSEMBLY_ACC=CAM_ASM_000384 /TAXON_ID=2969 /ORGANISM="Oxyrrhis marina" /LENGTH=455 /DNA_ID=CAMNT_0051333503 /DNA_START=1 /DNA_END=1368 /DNA_ORIENTATION=+
MDRRSSALGTLYFICFIDVVGFGLIFPLLPSIAASFGVGATEVGYLATTFSVGQVIFTPILGYMSDRYGRRPVLLLAIFGNGISYLATGLAQSFTVVLLARFVSGATGGSIGVANAYVADVTSKEERSVYMNYVTAATSIGIVIGPGLGGTCSSFGFSVVCYIAAGACLLNWIIGLLFLTEPPRGAGRDMSVDGLARAAAAAGQQDVGKIPMRAWSLYASSFCAAGCFAAWETVMAFFLRDMYFHGDSDKAAVFYGYLFVFAGITMLISSVFMYKPLLMWLGPEWLVVFGTSLRIIGYVSMALAPTEWVEAGVCQIMILGGNIANPVASAKLTEISGSAMVGRAMGFFQGAQGLARLGGPPLMGYVYDNVGQRVPFYTCGVLGFFAGVFTVVVTVPDDEDEGDMGMSMPGETAGDVSTPASTPLGGMSGGSRRNKQVYLHRQATPGATPKTAIEW